MRRLKSIEGVLDFQESHLRVTHEYRARYERISDVLEATPALVAEIHPYLDKPLKAMARAGRVGAYTSDTVLRILLCQVLEGESLRGIVIRIDDSPSLRRFARIHHGRMIDFTHLCRLKNAIPPEVWKRVNDLLARAAVQSEAIEGDRLRIDTTALETNIHWPGDSSLLWDTYRVTARLLESLRECVPTALDGCRLHPAKAKGLSTAIARRAGQGERARKRLQRLYRTLISRVDRLLALVPAIGARAVEQVARLSPIQAALVRHLVGELEHYRSLGVRVVDQARRRVLLGESVPNAEKLFSIFEPHTELIQRGKASKPVEFGHMVALQQVEGKFITDYEVFAKRPADHTLVDAALARHKAQFDSPPREFSADKGFYESMAKLHALEEVVEVVSIGKKGTRTSEETRRERRRSFKIAQRFRAGIEGSISFLKRAFRLWRCMNKGWSHFVATVGTVVLAHNLLVLARQKG